MKIVTYNVMIGGVFKNGDPKPRTPYRLRKVMNVLKKLSPDVLGLQETLAGELKESEKKYVVSKLQKKNDYHFQEVFDCGPSCEEGTGCALFTKILPVSKNKIGKNVQAVEMRFKGRAEDVYIVNVYLHYLDEKTRLPQIRKILEELSGRKYCVIMGDFNSISPAAEISAEDIKNFPPAMIRKYLKNSKKDGKICYDVIQAVGNAGYIDVALIDNKVNEVTDMTKFAAENGNHDRPIRMDYFFVTPELKPYIVPGSFKLHKENFVQWASDHFPWEMTLNDDLFKKAHKL